MKRRQRREKKFSQISSKILRPFQSGKKERQQKCDEIIRDLTFRSRQLAKWEKIFGKSIFAKLRPIHLSS